jgi:hypothetical protein
METHSITWFAITLTLTCVAFGIVMAWFHFRDLEKERKETINKMNADRERYFAKVTRQTAARRI